MQLESSLPRYSKIFSQRKPLAQKLGVQLMTCFRNLETFLNLEFETGKDVSENDGHIFEHNEEHDASLESSPSLPFATAMEMDSERNNILLRI